MSNYDLEYDEKRDEIGSLYNKFAEILGAEILESKENLCVVTFNRDLGVEILGRETQSPLVLGAIFSFEAMDCNGRTLNMGETVILPQEINKFMTILRKNGILITALHNHWLFEEPRLMYIHFESIDKPLEFARKVAEALKVLKKC